MQNKESIIAEHNAKMKKVKIDIQDNQLNLPILLWLPKMHKNPRNSVVIAASHSCTTKPASALITKCLKLIQKAHKTYCDRIKAYTGFNFMWIIDNSLEVHKLLTSSKNSKPKISLPTISRHYIRQSPTRSLKNRLNSLYTKLFTV